MQVSSNAKIKAKWRMASRFRIRASKPVNFLAVASLHRSTPDAGRKAHSVKTHSTT
jgi:hypothetical protein